MSDCPKPRQQIDLVAGVVQHHCLILAAGLAAAQLVQAKIGHDPVDPGIKRALEAEISDIPECLQKGFLINILGVVLGSGQVQGQPKNLLLILAHQGVKRSTRAACASRISSISGARACRRSWRGPVRPLPSMQPSLGRIVPSLRLAMLRTRGPAVGD